LNSIRSGRIETSVGSPGRADVHGCGVDQVATVEPHGRAAAVDRLDPAREGVVLADELGDEAVLGPLVEILGGASCWITPSLKTAIRSDIVSASDWSWVT
jgi:hypothetical protein